MADQKRAREVVKFEAGLDAHNCVKRHVETGAPQTLTHSRCTKLASLLTAPLINKSNSMNSPNLLGSILSLPVKEPGSLKLPAFNFGSIHNGAISRNPDSTIGTSLESFSIFKQPAYILQGEEEDKHHYLHEADLYDSWNKTTSSSLDVDLFPELF